MSLIDTDSKAYACIDKRCHFCHIKITMKDITPPRMVLESERGHIAHQDCLEYILKKYPDIPISELQGKIIRMQVESYRKKVLGF